MSYTYSVCSSCDSVNRVHTQKALQQSPTCGKCGATLPMHSLVTEVSASGLKKLIAKSDKPIIADFWASWCGPCKSYAPLFSQAARTFHQAVFVKVDTEKYSSLASELGIRGIPTTIAFKNGREYKRESGVLPESAIPTLID